MPRARNFFADVYAGRQAADDERAADHRNALAELQVGREQRVNALMGNPNATPDEFSRAGRSDIGNAITNNQQGQFQAVQVLGELATRALQLDPQSRRAVLKQAEGLPMIRDAFRTLGVASPGAQELDDAALEQGLKRMATFAQPNELDRRLGQDQRQFEAQQKLEREKMAQAERLAGAKPGRNFRTLAPEEVASSGLPPGTAAQIDETTGKVDVLTKRDNTGTLSQKDSTTAKMKLNTVTLARSQLKRIRDAFVEGRKGLNAFGPGQGMLPTQAGKKFDARVNAMRSTLTALTRVPGVGAMSDYETKLDQAKFPERGAYENVTEDTINGLDDQLALIERGYADLLSGTPPAALQDGAAPAAAGGEPVRVNTPEEAMALPAGTVFITPDGRRKVR